MHTIKQKSVFLLTGLEILGRVGRQIFIFFWKTQYYVMHFERHFAFQNA